MMDDTGQTERSTREESGHDPDQNPEKTLKIRFEEALELYNRGQFMAAYRRMSTLLADARDTAGGPQIAEALNIMGVIEKKWGLLDQALEKHLEAMKLLENTDRKRELAHTCNNIGNIYRKLGDFKPAQRYIEQSLQLKRQTGDFEGITISLNNLSEILLSQNQVERTRSLLEESLAITQKQNLSRGQAYTRMILGKALHLLGDRKSAREELEISLAILEKSNDRYGIARNLLEQARLFIADSQWDEATRQIERGLELAERENMLELAIQANLLLSETSENAGDLSRALSAHKEYSRLRSILFNEKHRARLAELQVAWESETIRRERELYRQQAQELDRVNQHLNQEIAIRQHREEELHQQESLLRCFIQAIPHGCVIFENGEILLANPAYFRSRGLPEDMEELRGIHDTGKLDLIHPDDYQDYHEKIPEIRCQLSETGSYYYERRIRRINSDSYRWYGTYIVRPNLLERHLLIEIDEDINERREAELSLRRSEEKFSHLFHRTPSLMALFRLDDRRLIDVNNALVETLDFTREKLVGQFIDQLPILPPGDLSVLEESIRGNHTGKTFEISLVTANDTRRTCLFSISRFHMEGHPHALFSGIDISEKRRFEEERDKIQKLDSLGVLAGGIAHDFNNILMVILGNLSLFMHRNQLTGKDLQLVSESEKGVERAKALANQLLTFAKGGNPIRTTEKIEQIIRDTTGFVLAGSDILGIYDIPDDIWPVDVDRNQISQVIENLVINAKLAMKDGGRITISAVNRRVEKGEIPDMSGGRYVRISVADEGVGIAPENLRKIFDPFFTTRKTGNGLGLSIVFSIMKKHNGHVSVESEPGVGTVFHLWLPASTSQPKSESVRESTLPKGNGSILVMDDDEFVLKISRNMLRHLGYQCRTVRDGREVLDLFTGKPDGETPRYDAVILDLTIPGGMGGRETIKRLLEIDPDVVGIVASGYSNDPVMTEYKTHGFRAKVSKPFTLEELGLVLRDALQTADSRAS